MKGFNPKSLVLVLMSAFPLMCFKPDAKKLRSAKNKRQKLRGRDEPMNLRAWAIS